MGNYKIKVNVEIEECSDTKLNNPEKKQDGSFEMNISEKDAISIDNVEKAILSTNYEAIRDAISEHLTEISKKNA
jgi:hypothetical protein